MVTGKTIRSIDHAIDWCIKGKRMVAVRSNNGDLHEHGHRMVMNMPFGKLLGKLEAGEILELHVSSDE